MKRTEVSFCPWHNLKMSLTEKQTKGKLVFRLSCSKTQSLFLVSCHALENTQQTVFCGRFCIGGWTPSQLITPLEIFSCLSFVPKVSISQAKLPMHYFWQKTYQQVDKRFLFETFFLRATYFIFGPKIHCQSVQKICHFWTFCSRKICYFWTQNTLPICSKQIFICHKVGLESTKKVLHEKISGETQLTTD